MLLCYITDRSQFPGNESARRRCLLEKITEAARYGVDFIQLREKDLITRELELLAREAVCAIRDNSVSTTQLLINSRTDVALAVGADGVHLRSDDISPSDVGKIVSHCGHGGSAPFTIGVSCHSIHEVRQAVDYHADFVVFGSIFQKKTASERSATGIEALHQACQEKIPVLALGGITVENAVACIQAGAGIASIRLFQENEVRKVVDALRSLPQLNVVD